LRLAIIHKRQGDREEALKYYNATGFIHNRARNVIRPLGNTNGLGFEMQYPPENELDFTREYAGKNGKVESFRPENEPIDGFVDPVSPSGSAGRGTRTT
jgi:hypothetical protein